MAKLKELFPEFYQSKLSILDLNNESENIIVLDTNYLLDILRLPSSIAKKYIEAIESVKSNLYIPYLVALEFNFMKSAIKKEKSHRIREYRDEIENSISGLKSKIEKSDLITSEEGKDKFVSEVFQLTDNYLKNLKEIVDNKIKKSITEEEEELYQKLITVINEKIGEKYEQQWIENIEKEGETRYKDGLPPGFDDQTKEEVDNATRIYGELKYQRKYGDLIIWKDIIKFAKKCKKKGKKLIFVTNDGKSKRKNDLLYKVKNLVVGPNIYLMNELQREAEKELYIVPNLRFLQLINDLSDSQMKEIKNLSKKKYVVKFPSEEIPRVLEELKERNNNENDQFYYGVTEDGHLYKVLKENIADTEFSMNQNDDYKDYDEYLKLRSKRKKEWERYNKLRRYEILNKVNGDLPLSQNEYEDDKFF